jgi:hypothetical protein
MRHRAGPRWVYKGVMVIEGDADGFSQPCISPRIPTHTLAERMKKILTGLFSLALTTTVAVACARGTTGPSTPSSSTGSGPTSNGHNPCPSLPCSLLDTYKVTYRVADGSLVGMDSYRFDPGDPSAGPAPQDGEAVLDISGDAVLVAELAQNIDAFQVNLSTGRIEKKPGYVPPSSGPSP